MKRSAPCHAGFTLIEILVALAIFSTILVLLLSAFTGAARTRDQLADRYVKSRQKAMLLDRLGSDLAGAVSSVRLPETHMVSREDAFSGQPGATLAFTAFAAGSDPDVRLSSGLVKIRFFPKVSSEPPFLDLYREQSDLVLIENRLPVRESRIARRIKGFKVELYDGSEWRTEWPPGTDRKGTLPQRVAFTLIDENGDSLRREVGVALFSAGDNVLFSGKRPKP
jgi:prepilin-type N-terminal cleavage/methylation domain-containing protein